MKSPGQIAFEIYTKAAMRDAATRIDCFSWEDLHVYARETWELTAAGIGNTVANDPACCCALHIGSAKIAVERLVPSRERSCVLTKLDEAEMWLERAALVR